MTSITLPRSKTASGTAYYEVGQGEVLLLVHGVGLCLDVWAPQIDRFAASCRVIAVDMPGHGHSLELDVADNIHDYVNWLAEFIKEIGCGPVNLCGHSMGAMITMGLALSEPQLVSRAALLCAVYRRPQSAHKAVQARAAIIAEGINDIEAPLARWFDPHGSIAERQAMADCREWLTAVSITGYSSAYSAFANGDAAFASHLHQACCPMLFLAGEQDQNSTAAMAEMMGAQVPNSLVAVIRAQKHMVPLVDPSSVNQHMAAWLAMPLL